MSNDKTKTKEPKEKEQNKNEKKFDLETVTSAAAIIERDNRKKLNETNYAEDEEEEEEEYEDVNIEEEEEIEIPIDGSSYKDRIYNIIKNVISENEDESYYKSIKKAIQNVWEMLLPDDEYSSLREICDVFMRNVLGHTILRDIYLELSKEESESVREGLYKRLANVFPQWIKKNMSYMILDYAISVRLTGIETTEIYKDTYKFMSEFNPSQSLEDFSDEINPMTMFTIINGLNKHDNSVSRAIRFTAYNLYNSSLDIVKESKLGDWRNLVLTDIPLLTVIEWGNKEIDHKKDGRHFGKIIFGNWTKNYPMELINIEDFDDSEFNKTELIEKAYENAYKIFETFVGVLHDMSTGKIRTGINRGILDRYLNDKGIGLKNFITRDQQMLKKRERTERRKIRKNIQTQQNIAPIVTKLPDDSVKTMATMLKIVLKNSDGSRRSFVNTCYSIVKESLRIALDIKGPNVIFITLLSKAYWVQNQDFFSQMYSRFTDAKEYEEDELEFIINKVVRSWSSHMNKWLIIHGETVLNSVNIDLFIESIQEYSNKIN